MIQVPGRISVAGDFVCCILGLRSILPAFRIREPFFVRLATVAMDVILLEQFLILSNRVIVVIHALPLTGTSVIVVLFAAVAQNDIAEVIGAARQANVSRLHLVIAAIELLSQRRIDRSNIQAIVVRLVMVRIFVHRQEVVQRLLNHGVMQLDVKLADKGVRRINRLVFFFSRYQGTCASANLLGNPDVLLRNGEVVCLAGLQFFHVRSVAVYVRITVDHDGHAFEVIFFDCILIILGRAQLLFAVVAGKFRQVVFQ